jgi:hypothetical protein
MELAQKAEADKQAQATAQTTAAPPEGGAGTKDENVVDAEFTEKKD